jgi:tetratricopeptide (TPR) repeat protein
VRQLIVRPTSAVLRYAESNRASTGNAADAAREAGRALGVDAVLDGSVQRADGKIRVSLQLVNVREGATLWAATIEEEAKDIFRLEDQVAAQVIRALSLDLANTERAQLASRGTKNTDAYAAHLKGRILWNKRTPDALKQSLAHFNSAIEQDPLYALAYSGLADSYLLLGEYNMAPPSETVPKAKAASQKELELDPNLGEAHTVTAYALANYDWNFPASEQEYRRALEFSPNYATAHQWYAEYLSSLSRFDEARREIRRAQELDPLSPIVGTVAALIECQARDCKQGITQLRRVIEFNPDFALAHSYLSIAYEMEGMREEAVAEQLKFFQLSGASPKVIDNLRQAYERGGFAAYTMARLELVGALEALGVYISPLDKIVIYVSLNDREQVLRWLEKAADEHVRDVVFINVGAYFDNLRGEPRFQALLRRIGLQAQ